MWNFFYYQRWWICFWCERENGWQDCGIYERVSAYCVLNLCIQCKLILTEFFFVLSSPKEPPPPPPPEKDWSEVESEVEHLTDDTFKGFLKKKKHVLVMFYAPCKLSIRESNNNLLSWDLDPESSVLRCKESGNKREKLVQNRELI